MILIVYKPFRVIKEWWEELLIENLGEKEGKYKDYPISILEDNDAGGCMLFLLPKKMVRLDSFLEKYEKYKAKAFNRMTINFQILKAASQHVDS